MNLELWRTKRRPLWLKHREEGGEYLTPGRSHLPQSLPSVWTPGLLSRLCVQGETSFPAPQSSLLPGSWFFLAASSSPSQPSLCKLSLLHSALAPQPFRPSLAKILAPTPTSTQ